MPMFEVSRADSGATIQVNIRDAESCAKHFAGKSKSKAFRLEEYTAYEVAIIPEYAGYRVWKVISEFNGKIRYCIKVRPVPGPNCSA